ncbi:MAG: RDD family protein [Verrucomicrobiaceae bacterium]
MKYHLARGEEQLGTFNDLDVSAGLRDGRFRPSDLCWTEGMAEWQALEVRMKELAVEAGLDQPDAVGALREVVRQDHEVRRELASRGQRLAAYFMDLAMLLVPVMILFAAVIDEDFEKEIIANRDNPEVVMESLQRQIEKVAAAGNVTVGIMMWIVLLLMVTNMILLTMRGQSLGKLLMGIQIVRFADGSRAGFIRAVLLRSILFSVIGNLRFIGAPLLIADILMIFRADQRCLHDWVADTQVVKKTA